jgi:hypothetical protein
MVILVHYESYRMQMKPVKIYFRWLLTATDRYMDRRKKSILALFNVVFSISNYIVFNYRTISEE